MVPQTQGIRQAAVASWGVGVDYFLSPFLLCFHKSSLLQRDKHYYTVFLGIGLGLVFLLS